MELKTKKIIAREFILILICLILTAVFYYIALFPYKNYQTRKYNEILVEIDESLLKIDSLRAGYQRKEIVQRDFFNYFYRNNFDFQSKSELWNWLYKSAKVNQIELQWNTNYSETFKEHLRILGYKTPKELELFILANVLNPTEDSDNQSANVLEQNILLLRDKKKSVNDKIYSDEDIENDTKQLFYFLLLMVFILRYLYHSVRWSINILKTN